MGRKIKDSVTAIGFMILRHQTIPSRFQVFLKTINALHPQKIFAIIFLTGLFPSYSHAQFNPLRDPFLDRLTRCLATSRTRPAGVDLAVMVPSFTRRSLPGGLEEFIVNVEVMNWGRTSSPSGTNVNFLGGFDEGDLRVLRTVTLPSIGSCWTSPTFSYSFTVSACATGAPGFNDCLRRAILARYNLFRVSFPSSYSDANNRNNSFEVSGSVLASRFGL